jgi:hypothetical protein
MHGNKKLFQTLGIIFFSAGTLAGMVLFILMNWAYFEAYFYFGYTAPADESLTTLRCPLMMTTGDTGTVTIRLSNNSDRAVSPTIRTEISYFGATRTDKNTYPLAVGETRILSWTVTRNDMVFGHLVMARVYVNRTYTLPSLSNTCGTVMVNIPGLTGTEVFVMLLAFSLGCLAAGWGLWLGGSRPVQADGMVTLRAMVFFTVIVLLGVLAGSFGWWGLGLICTALSVLLLFTVVAYYVQRA